MKIIKIADNHYRYGETNMEIAMTGGCDRCILDNICHGAEYIGCNLRDMSRFKLKENKMESKIFVVDNGDKQFKAELFKRELYVCFQVLENKGELRFTNNVILSDFSSLFEGKLTIGGIRDKELEIESFKTNAKRDEYFTKACAWFQEFVDINSKVEKFDVYDVYNLSENNQKWLYDGKNEHKHRVFQYGMAQDNFAGIKYAGNKAWITGRVLTDETGGLWRSTTETDENVTQAIPEKIRFFKDAK